MKKIWILSTINLLFVIICCTIVVFAWFSMNKITNGNGMQIVLQQNDINIDYSVYKYNNNTFYDVTDTNDTFILNPYDTIIKERNVHTSIILKLIITGQAVLERDNIFISINCSETNSDTMYLSNAVYFKFGLFNIDSNDIETIYTTAESNFNQINNKYTFVDNIKNTLIIYTISNYNDYIVNNSLTLFIEINYDEDLVEQLVLPSYEDFGTTIAYTPDIRQLVVYTGDD